QFWVVAPALLAATSEQIFDVVRKNLKAGVSYTYFIYDNLRRDVIDLKTRLAHLLDLPMTDVQLKAYGLPHVTSHDQEFVTRLFGTVYLVANPQRMQQAVAYQCIRKHGITKLALKLDET